MSLQKAGIVSVPEEYMVPEWYACFDWAGILCGGLSIEPHSQ